jgi:hypothetical protein
MKGFVDAGRKGARFLGQPAAALAFWLFTALLAQLLVAVALLVSDTKIDGLREGFDTWLEDGGAPTVAVGLLAAALAESIVQARPYTRAHGVLAILGTALIFYIAAAHNDVLRGDGTAEEARNVSAGLIAGAATLGAATAFVSAITRYRAERQTRRTEPVEPPAKAQAGETADVS